MKCEEFEEFGLDADRDPSLSELQRASAAEHAGACPRCAALQDSWQSARAELRAFAEETVAVETPARVEMRLRQEFRTQHRTYRWRLAAVAASWALAAATVLAGALSWNNWLTARRLETAKRLQSGSMVPVNGAKTGTAGSPSLGAADNSDESLVANNELNDFTMLPGVLPAETEESEILRVRMQRGELGALGLPVNEERAGEWIQVDLLVGTDGLPQAVRLLEDEGDR